MVSIKDVAKIAGVSIATVSRTINNKDRVNEETRERVRRAIESTGFSPNTLAQNFRRGRTNFIMVVLPSIGDPFFAGVVKGIQSIAQQKGYNVLFSETKMNSDEFTSMLVSRQADGLILLATVPPAGVEILSRERHRALPIVIACEAIQPEMRHLPSVHIDNVAAAKEATRFLISHGHERIAFISGTNTSLLTKDREAGYRAAMKAAKLPIQDGWVLEGKLTIDGAIKATRNLLHHASKPTAILCANDDMAIGALHEIRSTGLSVPDDISVVGFDDIRYSQVVNPPLTTVRQPAEEIGEKAMYRICHAIEEGVTLTAEPELVPHELVIRRSVARRN
ncbi:MAG TPA: LacI family DNA-binding transcriptional regulator [Povalibacter sp.]|uniref:LacI family DNA-binding transcriptional regulator n=1 Tax=Povalibacter sp. TaxID=1962978 RepID=UPI002CD4C7A7|nr:LacI family DNA-binding transcriptional regulator [Povalibacter sp.]HMN43224.1 LacI family DNA-binding transcriptional regulator [Povalibacter sp.]